MITKNKTGKYSFLKYTLSVIAALSITLCFAVNSTPSEELKTVIFKGEITTEEALIERNAAVVDRELALTEKENLKGKLLEEVSEVVVPVKSESKEQPNDVSQQVKEQVKSSTTKDSVKVDEPYVMVEDMPEFPGGDKALRQWIAENVKYPVVAAEKGIQGKVYITFIVEKDGSVSRAKVVRGVDASLDAEALRVTNALPKWKPGFQKGKAVPVSFTIPINFQLNGPDNGKKIDETVVVGYDKKTTISNDSIYQESEVMPEFPGGDLGVRKYIAENIKYPSEARKYSEQGKVYVTFVIAKDGAVEKVKVVRGVTPALDNEAVRVVSSMPNWTPGKNKGETVSVQYTIPVNFQLQ